MKKQSYSKPECVSFNKVAIASGASACTFGTNPDLVPACIPGASADTNCDLGGAAGQLCNTGTTPGIVCFSGTTYE